MSERFGACILIGQGTLLLRCAAALQDRNYPIAAIVSPDESVRQWARARKIPLLESAAAVATFEPPVELLFSIVNGEILSEQVLQRPRRYAINYHDSLLPRYAGMHAPAWALLNRETTHGVTWHVMNDLVDSGDILKQRSLPIAPDDTTHTLNWKCYEAAYQTFLELLNDLDAGTVTRLPQVLEQRTYFPSYKKPPDYGIVSWTCPARDIDALIRALDFGPYPNRLGAAKIKIGQTYIIVSDSRIVNPGSNADPGTLVDLQSEHLTVAASDADLQLSGFTTIDGAPLSIAQLTERFALKTGHRLDEAASKFIEAEWNNSQRPFPENDCIHHLFETQAERSPHAVAAVCEGRQITYGELNARANQLAHLLQRIGVSTETIVAIFIPRSIELVLGLLGILKAGAAYLPLTPETPPKRREFMLADAECRHLVTQHSMRKRIPSTGIDVVCLEDIPPDTPSANLSAAATSANLAYVIYTSGSTGDPKGVLIPHRGVVNWMTWMRQTFDLTSADRVLSKAPLTFDISVWEIFLPLIIGATTVLAAGGNEQDIAYLARLTVNEEIAFANFVPSMLSAILDRGDLTQARKLRHVIGGGEVMTASLQRRFFEQTSASLCNSYGPTEASIGITYWPCVRGDERPTVPIGRVIMNNQIYILDPHGHPVPIGTPGELYLGGVGLARGYLNRPELTAEKFVRNPFSPDPAAKLYRTGDLGYFLPDGNIEFLGRADHQVKIRGFRIELAEIEAALSRHSGVANAAVTVNGDAPNAQRLAGYWTSAPGTPPTAQTLRTFLSETLPAYMIPSSLIHLETLPLTPNGKIDRHALPAPDLSTDSLFVIPPQTPTQHRLLDIWTNILATSRFGITDDFFELGGNSLSAAALITGIERESKKQLSLVDILRAPTIERLSALLTANHLEQPKNSDVIPLQPKGARIPIFGVSSHHEDPFCFRQLSLHLGEDQPFFGIRNPVREDQSQTVENLANRVRELIQSTQPNGPYILAGFCFGGLVAFEAAHQLLSAGEPISQIFLFDTLVPDTPKCLRTLTRHWNQLRRAFSLPHEPESAIEGALRLYAPRPITAPIMQFYTKDQPVSTRILQDPRLAWNDLCKDFSAHPVPGIHDGLFLEREAVAIAAVIKNVTVPKPRPS